MATIITDGKMKEVKNLGWLLRHWQEVEFLGFNLSKERSLYDGELIAKCGKTTYLTNFSSFDVCWDFLNRSVFRGRKLIVKNHDFSKSKTFIVGDVEYLSIKRLDRLEKVKLMLE